MSLDTLGSDIEYDLNVSGYRMTKLRLALNKIFALYKLPLSANELLEILKKRGLKIHKVTLYRELDFLVDKQVIQSVNLNDGQQRFEYLDRDHHHHLVCVKCRDVQDLVKEDDLKELELIVQKQNKFTILKHSLEFFGLCQKCQSHP